MFGFLLALMLLDGILLTVVVLLQSGKGGGLASMGGGAGSGTDTLIGGRQAATILTKASWATGGIFLFLAMTLAVMSSRAQRPNSILRDEFKGGSAQPAATQQVPGAQTVPGAQPAATQQQPAPAGQAPAPATTNK